MNQNSNGIVRTEREGSTLIIEIDRQDKMNGFTPEMFEGITSAGTLGWCSLFCRKTYYSWIRLTSLFWPKFWF